MVFSIKKHQVIFLLSWLCENFQIKVPLDKLNMMFHPSQQQQVLSLSPLGLCWDLCVDCSTDWWKCWANSSAQRPSQGRDLLWSLMPLSPWGLSFSCGCGDLELFCRLGALLIGGASPKREWSCSGASGGGSLGRKRSGGCECLWRSIWLTLWRCLVGPGGVGLRELGWGSPFDWQGVEGVVGSEKEKYQTLRKTFPHLPQVLQPGLSWIYSK